MSDSKFTMPTEMIDLPSRGLVYPKEHPLSSGVVEMKYVTALEEDILTNINYMRQGIVLDKYLESLTLGKINIDDLIMGDKEALLISSRILGYGSEYKFTYDGEEHSFDLTKIPHKEFDSSLLVEEYKNEFEFTLTNGDKIRFKILTGKDEKAIKAEEKGMKKINKNYSGSISLRLKQMITSVNNSTDPKDIREFVDRALLAKDSKALRDYVYEIQPYLNYNIKLEDGREIELPISESLFWPG